MFQLFNIFSVQTRYIWRIVWQDLLQHKLGTLLTVLVISVSLTIPMVGYLLWKNTHNAATQFYPEQELTIYLHKNLSKSSVNLIVEKIRQFEPDKMENFEFISRQQSLNDFRQWSGFSKALDILDDNPLPTIVILKPKKEFSDTEHMLLFRNELQNIKGIQEVRLDNEWLEKLTALTWLIAKVGVICALLMSISVFLVIANSVRTEVSNNKATIEVMQLVGATKYFIARRFIYTAMIYGLLGSILAILLALVVASYFSNVVRYVADLFVVKFELNHFNFSEIFFVIIFCIFIGWLSAKVATKNI
ncbi:MULTISPECIES: permease-like cell division protein FtsX [Pasteurellaceae]|uniref:Cell division protein FtsX n=1 Tax=Pasteurella atlantica TaxID=2827233 RepID=A0AAW8CQT6_9PAST|nr:permease-like cell division protein FtsX [Pasteurella atlantica]MBR0573812.1 permease-like cell division protein FtsX [Pasteurella atlantica]MDP8039748.1 permease-like cell division protein FtsX [Pasteurella atlantica]MDP8041933.1 permease-like cell division protein FtsX [Pasteurella atlantica]MDP8044042.1 permease-like cell division protein FtsX [Pasteurella atlantica]MDP8046020.1 permease-like cell division protein FtsX [Pasteurella atlantica]